MNLVAQMVAEFQPFAQYGLLGAVLGWLAVRVEKRLDRMEHVITGLSKTLLIEILDRPTIGITAKRMAKEALTKMGVSDET